MFVRFFSAFISVLWLVVAFQAHAQEPVGMFRSYLSIRDHYNSSGKALYQGEPSCAQGVFYDRKPEYTEKLLQTAAAILRQDQANVHRYGLADSVDEKHRFFASTESRAQMEDMLRRGYPDRDVLYQIVCLTPIVYFTVYEFGPSGPYIEIHTE